MTARQLFGLACRCCLLTVCMPFFACGPSRVEAAEVVNGVLTNINGVVEVLRAGTTEWIPATKEMVIRKGDRVSTGLDGSVGVKCRNSAVDVGTLTFFELGESHEEELEISTSVMIVFGKALTTARNENGKPHRFEIVTPDAVTTAVGEQNIVFDVSHSATGTFLRVMEGDVEQKPAVAGTAEPAGPVAPPIKVGEGQSSLISQDAVIPPEIMDQLAGRVQITASSITPAELQNILNSITIPSDQPLTGAGGTSESSAGTSSTASAGGSTASVAVAVDSVQLPPVQTR